MPSFPAQAINLQSSIVIQSMTPLARIEALRAAFPSEGLFRDKAWLMSPRAFPLPSEIVAMIEALGPALRAFQIACDQIYFESAEAPQSQRGWVAKLLDQGKPVEIVELGRVARWRNELPRVIRPDLVLTDTGLCLSEIDSLPGGMGLTAWLHETYAALGDDVIGGAQGMIAGFASAYPQHDVLISAESADYEPEMRWMLDAVKRITPEKPTTSQVWKTSELAPSTLLPASSSPLAIPSLYRFFELFDLANIEHAADWLRLAREGAVNLTPPLKAHLEEKLWLALFWSPQLADYWASVLGREHHSLLSAVIPQGWVVDPTMLPATAVLPGLEIHSWDEAKLFGNKARELVLKISGFSELGWGSRGVFIGHDMSRESWARALDDALAEFASHPYILQHFQRGRLVHHPAWNEATGIAIERQSRVRLCPYYFVAVPAASPPKLGGILATVCPADKKILHGMTDAMMLPCVAA